jgi:hypothetical protein
LLIISSKHGLNVVQIRMLLNNVKPIVYHGHDKSIWS